MITPYHSWWSIQCSPVHAISHNSFLMFWLYPMNNPLHHEPPPVVLGASPLPPSRRLVAQGFSRLNVSHVDAVNSPNVFHLTSDTPRSVSLNLFSLLAHWVNRVLTFQQPILILDFCWSKFIGLCIPSWVWSNGFIVVLIEQPASF